MTNAGASRLTQLSPFLLLPRYDVRVWGYRDLRPWYDQTAGKDPIGEVWLTGDENIIATGQFAGRTLGSLFAEQPEVLLGPDAPHGGSPLLLKVLFAKEKLSVQVHPDDQMAQKYGDPRGKTECWYALFAEPGALVAAGLKPGVSLDQVKAGIHDGTLEESMAMIPVTAGDMIFVDAGTVHAIWPGSVLLETQQNSDLTYRMYDYGRPRPLHIDKSIEATRLVTRAGKIAPVALADRTILIDVEYFRVERLPVSGHRTSETLPAHDEPTPGLSYLFAAAGSARLTGPEIASLDLPERGVVAVPAGSPSFEIDDLGGLELMRISPKWPSAK